MSRSCGLRPLLAALLAACFAGAALPAHADDATPTPPKIYRWIDENGIAHYTTDPKRIPGALRSKIPDAAPAPLPPAEAAAPKPSAKPLPTTPPASAPTPPASSEAKAPGKTPAPAGQGPDTWAAEDRGSVPARTLTTAPFSEGGPSAPPATSAPPPGSAPERAAGTAPQAAPPRDASSGAASPATSSAASAASASSPSSASSASSRSALDDLDYRIASLQADIQADEKLIASRLGNPKSGGPLADADDAKFREAAFRLPKRLKELKKLQEEREKLVHGSGS